MAEVLAGRVCTEEAGPLFGRDSIYMVMRGSCISFKMASSSGLFPVLSGLTVDNSLANMVHIALSADTNCCKLTFPNPGGGSVE